MESAEDLSGASAQRGVPLHLYGQYFDTVRATTPALLRECYRLRYQVYCVEHSFLEPADNPGGFETDEFDHRSLHSLLIHRSSGAPCGTVRLILPDTIQPMQSFPAQRVSKPAAAMIARLPLETTAEISRFAVSKDFRRRSGETLYADAEPETLPPPGMIERRLLPHITYGLFRAVMLMSLDHGITHVCAVMDPTLLRLVSRFGFHFASAGPLVNYHGMRQPCFALLTDLMDGIREAREDMWAAGTEGGRLVPSAALEVHRKRDRSAA